MIDVALRWGADGGDLAIEKGDLALELGLTTAVLVSLFSDGQAPADPAVSLLEQDRRGWWAETDAYGSRLWQIASGKATAEVAAQARDFARAALEWLVLERIAKSVEVQAVIVRPTGLRLTIKITRGTARRWAAAWQAVEGVKFSAGDTFLQVVFA